MHDDRNQEVESGEKLVGLKSIAGMLGVSYRTVRRWNQDGIIPKPALTAGRKYWTEPQILRWMQSLDDSP